MLNNNNNNNETSTSEEIRRRRPSSVHTVSHNGHAVSSHFSSKAFSTIEEPKTSTIVRQDTTKSRSSIAEAHQVELILEEIAADQNSTFL
uniref:Uncharacterized protein n=1 Tax=Caenorhabditis japonica TaxID=281687 RepID=A0A8R1IG01_CAEJA